MADCARKDGKKAENPGCAVSKKNCVMIFCLEVLNIAMGQTVIWLHGCVRLAAHNQEQAQALAQACEPEPAEGGGAGEGFALDVAGMGGQGAERFAGYRPNLGGCGCLPN